MISMDLKQQFLHLYRVDELSLREIARRTGVRTFTADHFKVALQTMKGGDEPFREEQQTDEFIEIETLEFIRTGRNIVIFGNPGTGKTHIAIGLGINACMEGYTVFFTTVPHMLTLIRETRTDRTLQSLEPRFRKYDLVICDEMGYVSFDKEGAELLFNMISTRTGDKATIITTNLPFTRWEEIIKDKVLCSALVDRLCHKAFMVNMTGPSYRVKETQNIFKKL